MTGIKSDRNALARLADAFVEEILSASDEDILAEAMEDHPDPAAAAAQALSLFEKAAAVAGKGRLIAARAALAQHQGPASVTRLDPTEARRRLQHILTRDPDMARRLTHAARKDQGKGLSDREVQDLLDDLAELGISVNPASYEAVAALTAPEQVLADLGITDPSEIDLEAIAWTLGARVRYRPMESCEARIVGNGDRAIITVNDRSHPHRQRFSVAHELGHWRYHRGRLLVCHADDIGGAGERRPMSERTADNYAAHLLMPAYLFDPIARSHSKLSFQTVRTVADIFDTSLTSTAIRLIDSRHTPAVLVCHGPQGRKWFARSPDVPDRWFPQDNLDSESFAFSILFGDAPDDRTPHKIGADAWFDRREAERFEVLEQTIRTAPDEILSFVLITDGEMLDDFERRERTDRRRP